MDQKSYLTLETDEEVLLTRHKHWINILPVIVSTVLLLAFISYALGWLLANPTSRIGAIIPAPALATLLLGLGGLSVLILVIAYLVYRQNRVTLTNRHYMQINQTGLFNRTVSKLTLDEIQDCKGNRRGFFATLINYGEILIETAGENQNFNFNPVADPLNLAEAINDAHEKYGQLSTAPSQTSSTEPRVSQDPPPVAPTA